MKDIFWKVSDLYGASAIEARKVILGVEQEIVVEQSVIVGETTTMVQVGPSARTQRLRLSSPPIEVVKPPKRRKKGVAPQGKGLEPSKEQIGEGMEKEASVESSALVTDRRKLGKKNAKEVTAKRQALHVVDLPLRCKENAEMVPTPEGKDIDATAANEVMGRRARRRHSRRGHYRQSSSSCYT
ncbi:hypothetical protein Dimus_027080, partial [Dionaea muscipula]